MASGITSRPVPGQNLAGNTAEAANGNAAEAGGTNGDVGEGKKKGGRKPNPNKPERVDYNGECARSEDGKFLTAVPTDYDAKKHLPLKKKDFAIGQLFYDFRVQQAEEALAKAKKRAEEERTLGGAQDRAKKKRLLKMAEDTARLRAELEAMGVDVDALLKLADAGESSESENQQAEPAQA